MKIYIDAEKAVAGRLGSYVAKELLKGNEVVVVNSEKAFISGDRVGVVDKIRTMRQKGGNSLRGPKIPRIPERILKRIVRGMLPWGKPRGQAVYKKLKCYSGNDLKEEENKQLKNLNHKVPIKYVTLEQVVKLI